MQDTFQQLFEQSADGILLLEDDRFFDCNQAALDMFGYRSKAHLLQQTPANLSPEFQPDGRRSAEKAREYINTAIQKKNLRFDWVHKKANGEEFLVEVLLTHIELSGRSVLHTVLRDIHRSIVAERNRIARDLHDSVTQTLFSATLIAQVLPGLWQKDQDMGLQQLEELRRLTRGAMAEMRTLLLELRPETLLRSSLEDSLKHLVDATSGRASIPVDYAYNVASELMLDVKVALYRIAQEALNNVAKHADATRARVSIVEQDQIIVLEIQDNGCGFDPEKVTGQQLGLNIMLERAAEIGARLNIASDPCQGTTIRMEWGRLSEGEEDG